jgi:hypothetical protein
MWNLNNDWNCRVSAQIDLEQFASTNINISLLAFYKSRMRFGLIYCNKGVTGLIFQLSITEPLFFGYAMDYQMFGLVDKTFGKHEFFLSYKFLERNPKRKCPIYFN